MPIAGLCGHCRHARLIVSGKGSTFLRCGRSDDEPRYPRYPVLPRLACAGHEEGTPEQAGRAGEP